MRIKYTSYTTSLLISTRNKNINIPPRFEPRTPRSTNLTLRICIFCSNVWRAHLYTIACLTQNQMIASRPPLLSVCICIFFGSKTTICLSLNLHKERPSYRSLQLSKEAIQHFKTWTLKKKFYFCGSFLPSWFRIRIPNPDPDPLTRLNPDPIRIRIRVRIRNPAAYTTYLFSSAADSVLCRWEGRTARRAASSSGAEPSSWIRSGSSCSGQLTPPICFDLMCCAGGGEGQQNEQPAAAGRD